MKFEHLLTHKIIISRMTSVSGYKVAMSTVTSAYVNLQPLTAQDASLGLGVYGKSYKIYCDSDLAVKDGDKLKDENNNIYTVQKGGATTRSQGSIEYQELIITK